MNVKIPGPRDFLRYVWGLRTYLLVVIVLFAMFYVIGYVAVMTIPDLGSTIVSNFKQEVSPLKQASALGLMLGIFGNNALKCLMVIVLGLAFGIAPALFVLANGLILGIVIGVTVQSTSWLYILVGVVPHGLIELPMVFISSAIGLKLGVDMLLKFIKGNVSLSKEIKEALLIYFVWVLPLLFLAAAVETFVTGPLLYLIFGGQG